MKHIMRTALCLSLVWVLAQNANAQVKQTSDLFPDSTAAYLELTGTEQLAGEIASLTKGSFLDDFPASLDAFRPKNTRNRYWMFNEMAYMSGFLTSNALAEFRKFEGGAVAVTQMPAGAQREPRVIAVLRTGDSNMVHLMMRMMMISLKPVAKVEGEWLFQEERRFYREKFPPGAPGAGAQQPQTQMRGPVVAIPAGAFIIGSHKEDVADMIRRLKGKGKGPSLTENKDFMQAAQIRPKDGLFAYADTKALVQLPGMVGSLFYGGSHSHGTFEKVEGGAVDPGPIPPEDNCGGRQFGKQSMSGTQDLIRSLGSLGRIALSVSLENGALEIKGRINTDPNNPTGWSNFFTKRTLNRELLQYIPADYSSVFAFALPDGSAFWDKLDKTAPVFETDISFLLGVKVLDIAQFVGTAGYASAGREPMYVVEAVSQEKARSLANTLAKVLKAEAEVSGKIIVLARDAKTAKAAIAMGQAKKGMLAQPWVAQATKGLSERHVVLLMDIGKVLQRSMRNTPVSAHNHDGKVDVLPGVPGAFPQAQPKRAVDKRFEKFAVQLGKTWAETPPLVISLGKSSTGFVIQGAQHGLQKTLAPTLDTWMHYYTHWTASNRYGFNAVGDAIKGVTPPPAPPNEK